MKKYLIDLGMGGIAGIICFVLALIIALLLPGSIYFLAVLVVLAVISALVYIKSAFYRRGHLEVAVVSSMLLFFCGVVLIYFTAFYIMFLLTFRPTVL